MNTPFDLAALVIYSSAKTKNDSEYWYDATFKFMGLATYLHFNGDEELADNARMLAEIAHDFYIQKLLGETDAN